MAKTSSQLPQSLSTFEIQTLLRQGLKALNERRFEEAGACCRQVLSAAPRNVEAHFLVGLIANQTKEFRFAIQAFGSVTTIDPSHAAGWAQLARNFIKIGRLKKAEEAVEKAIRAGTEDPIVEDLIGTTLSLLGDQYRAEEWYARAVEKMPKSAKFNLNLASAQIFLGKKKEAEKALDRALKTRPDEPQGHWRKSTLTKATDHRHIEVLEDLMKKFKSDPRALSFVAYAAGKEYEDLGEWENAFKCFERGAKAKKKIIEFDEAEEEEMFKALRETFDADWVSKHRPGNPAEAPIFIVGQPRTGTTLVERIITAHSMVHSAGELQQFRLSVRRNAKIETPKQFSAEVARASGKAPPARIGTAYMRSSASMQGDLARFVDKMPTNYLFIPLIVKALPNAKILHLVRDPMDSCFSSYKQLFAEAYYHSYDLREMARHYVRYHRLMEYWRKILPGKFLDVKYEEVVSDLEPKARRMIEYLELPWEDACLEFHKQDQAVTTASAIQVREKVHTRSVGRWRKYEEQMQPALEILRREEIVA